MYQAHMNPPAQYVIIEGCPISSIPMIEFHVHLLATANQQPHYPGIQQIVYYC